MISLTYLKKPFFVLPFISVCGLWIYGALGGSINFTFTKTNSMDEITGITVYRFGRTEKLSLKKNE